MKSKDAVTALVALAYETRFAVFESGAALATVVGVLIEVHVMLLVVNASRGWYEHD